MRLILNGLLFLFDWFILHKSLGYALNRFCRKMGITYIKFAQILAMQNIDGLFTQNDRDDLLNIVDDCNRISFDSIDSILHETYGNRYTEIIQKIDEEPVGSASVSQVHKAILTNGNTVVFKVKRRDIDKTIRKDVRKIKVLIRLFGKFFGFSNYMAGNKALDMYIDWILQELDFKNEVNNIIKYHDFAESVNGKVPGMKKILVPKVYSKYCTEHVICMEYVPYQTINRLTNTPDIKLKISNAYNSYLKLSFYALLHNMPVAFHGDPHTGNVYLDDDGNIGFLDMGLVFYLNSSEMKKMKNLFLLAYFGRHDALYETLKPNLYEDDKQAEMFHKEVEIYCNNLHNKPVTSYFMDLCLICFRYNIVPDAYLFKIAKALVTLSGVDTVYENTITAHKLLDSMIMEYIFKEIHCGCERFFISSMKSISSIVNKDKDAFFDNISDTIGLLHTFIQSIQSS